MSSHRYFSGIAILAAAGAVVSALALRLHYHRDGSSFCSFNTTFDCDVVNRSGYATVAGIPVALVGLLGYMGMLLLVVFQRRKPETATLVLLLSSLACLFSLYLTYVEGAVLRAWCILCLASQLLIILIAALSALRVRADLRGAQS